MSSVAKVVYFWRTAVSGMRHAPFVNLIAITTLAIALFSFGLVRGAWGALSALLAELSNEVALTVYVADRATDAQVLELTKVLSEQTGGKARVVSKEEALERLRNELKDLGGALEGLARNPLPRSIEVELARVRDAALLNALVRRTRELPMVLGVDYGQEAVDRLTRLARLLQGAGAVALLLVLVVTVVVVSATLQLAIYARRGEIEIQKLVGATDVFVRVPFLLEGLLQGALGGAIAVLALLALSAGLGPSLGAALSFLSLSSTPPSFLTRELVLELVSAGLFLGLGGSLVAVGRFLRV